MNESVAYNWTKLKHNGIIHDCFLRDGIIRIKYQGKDRLMKIFHVDKFHEFFSDFDFGDANDKEDCIGNGDMQVKHRVRNRSS